MAVDSKGPLHLKARVSEHCPSMPDGGNAKADGGGHRYRSPPVFRAPGYATMLNRAAIDAKELRPLRRMSFRPLHKGIVRRYDAMALGCARRCRSPRNDCRARRSGYAGTRKGIRRQRSYPLDRMSFRPLRKDWLATSAKPARRIGSLSPPVAGSAKGKPDSAVTPQEPRRMMPLSACAQACRNAQSQPTRRRPPVYAVSASDASSLLRARQSGRTKGAAMS